MAWSQSTKKTKSNKERKIMRLAIRLARQSLASHKLRSRLSTIGIVISVFLVSTILIISDSLKTSLEKQMEQLGNNTIIVNGRTSQGLINLGSTADDTLNASDNVAINNISSSHGDNNQIIISNLLLPGSLSFNKKTITDASIVATSMVDPSNLKLELLDGNWFSSDEINKPWVILGENLANKLIGTSHSQSEVIDIKGYKYTVIGVLEKISQPLSVLGYDINNSAFISLDNGQKINGNNNLSQIIIQNTTDINEIKRQISQSLSRNHTDSSDYLVETSSDISNRLAKLIKYLTIGAIVIAGLILVISIVSIANIMLVNIIEKRHEIGIRKAVGATTRNIMGQFIAESLIMSLRGGLIGLALAYLISVILLLFLSINLSFSWLALGLGFTVPVIAGIVAGLYPAYRASRQNIIAALNQLT